MKKLLLALALLLLLAGGLAADDHQAQAVQSNRNAAQSTDSSFLGSLFHSLLDLLGFGPDLPGNGDGPVLDDGSGSGPGYEPAALTEDNGGVEPVD